MHGFRAHRVHARGKQRLHAALERRQREDRRCADAVSIDVACGFIPGGEVERCAMSHPARQWLWETGVGERALVTIGNVEVRGCARSAVQVLVAAPHGEVGVRRAEVDRHCAGRVREIPDHQAAGLLRALRHRRQRMLSAGAVVDVGEHHDGNAVVDRGCDLVEFGRRIS
jgi:hypothetical protein